jgi:broad specificity phosphatase PhoE
VAAVRTIEVRRHCLTKKGEGRGRGSHLSAAGVAQARRIGDTLGPFDRVLTSHIPRTLETALAMGFAVDDCREVLGDIPLAVWDEIGHHERWDWPDPFVRFAALVRAGGPTAALGRAQRDAWAAALEAVPEDGGSVLVVSHGRVIEAGLVACVAATDAEYAAWGAPFAHGEGVRLSYEAGRFHSPVFRRGETAPAVQ